MLMTFVNDTIVDGRRPQGGGGCVGKRSVSNDQGAKESLVTIPLSLARSLPRLVLSVSRRPPGQGCSRTPPFPTPQEESRRLDDGVGSRRQREKEE